MDHYIPKRRVAVTLWSSGLEAVAAQLFLDLLEPCQGSPRRP